MSQELPAVKRQKVSVIVGEASTSAPLMFSFETSLQHLLTAFLNSNREFQTFEELHRCRVLCKRFRDVSKVKLARISFKSSNLGERLRIIEESKVKLQAVEFEMNDAGSNIVRTKR